MAKKYCRKFQSPEQGARTLQTSDRRQSSFSVMMSVCLDRYTHLVNVSAIINVMMIFVNCIVNQKGDNYNDVLPLKAARRDSISNLTSFGASNLSCSRTQWRFIQSLWAVMLVPHRGCAIDWDKMKQCGWVKLRSGYYAVCGTKFMKVCDIVGGPPYFLTPLPDCLCHVSFSRYSPLSVIVVEKPNKCKSFLAPFFSAGTTPTFLRQIVSAAYRPPFDKVWLSSVCYLRQRSLAMKWNAEFSEGG